MDKAVFHISLILFVSVIITIIVIILIIRFLKNRNTGEFLNYIDHDDCYISDLDDEDSLNENEDSIHENIEIEEQPTNMETRPANKNEKNNKNNNNEKLLDDKSETEALIEPIQWFNYLYISYAVILYCQK